MQAKEDSFSAALNVKTGLLRTFSDPKKANRNFWQLIPCSVSAASAYLPPCAVPVLV